MNLALDRPAFGAGRVGAHLTDQVLPHVLPGFRDGKIYPLNGPDLATARRLARGNLRGGKAVLYLNDNPLSLGIGQVLKRQLAAIDLDVEVRPIPGPAINARLATPGEPFDITFLVTPNVDYYDPYAFLNVLFESRFIGRTNWSHLRSAKSTAGYVPRRVCVAPLAGSAYGRLDVDLAREVAPLAARSLPRPPGARR